MSNKVSFKAGYKTGLTAVMSALILGACATTPEIREIEGPIVLDAPDSVVRADPAPSPTAQAPQQGYPQNNNVADPYPYEEVQSVPVTPITCPAGSSPQPDGSCMLTN